MSLDVLKWILLGVMALITIFFGLLPLQLINYLNNEHSRIHKRASLVLSLISCFAGGVFLSVCFLDMLPDSLEAWEDVKSDTGCDIDYPFVQLIALIGFFFVYIMEEISTKCCGGHGHSHSGVTDNVTFPRARLATVGTIFDIDGNVVQPCKESVKDLDVDGEGPIQTSLIFASAFILHVFFECFAFGVQEDAVSLTSLFLGIIVHKSVVMFSLGMKLSRNHPRRKYIVVIIMATIAAFNIFGGMIGILIEDSQINQTPKDIVTFVLLSFSLGNFIYITFFEMLSAERANNHSNILQWFFTFAGFVLIAIIMIWSS
ncbi:unnamed protein product [Caenorhabditis bovis]|uniref:Uncharacterized protein n=1 Tax=Caenorhabditis bovis TaxID=2654633 RepID=A0A8S1FD13_9PELO|nr:unnamed protein product [Caenorhabditis bovis]